MLQATIAALPPPAGIVPAPQHRATRAPLPLEETWRLASRDNSAAVVATRWKDSATGRRHLAAEAPADRHVISVALQRTRVRLTAERRELFDGVMAAGTVHLTRPSRRVEAVFHGPCDFIHLYVAGGCWQEPEDVVLRDPLAGPLARTLTEDTHASDPLYAESIARTLLLRLAALSRARPPAAALPKWRLKRVQDHVREHLGEAISLADIANAAGLSRSYFAAQFRAATGCRPHDYIAEQRIERAKEMLAGETTPIVQIALAVGFQTQAHFSTVFKRQTGTTPARYRLAQPDRIAAAA